MMGESEVGSPGDVVGTPTSSNGQQQETVKKADHGTVEGVKRGNTNCSMYH